VDSFKKKWVKVWSDFMKNS